MDSSMDFVRREVLYEGTSKILYATDSPMRVVQYFKDDVPEGRRGRPVGESVHREGGAEGRGVVKNRVSSLVFGELERAGVPTHFLRRVSEREMLVRRTEVLPVVAVVRNFVAGSLAARFDRQEGERLTRPLFELYFKKADGKAVMVNDGHCLVFGWVSHDELEELRRLAFRVNQVLVGFFRKRAVRLVDFRMEIGRAEGRLWVADELTPDSCRLWDERTGRALDEDIYGLTPGVAAGSELHWIINDRQTPDATTRPPRGTDTPEGEGGA